MRHRVSSAFVMVLRNILMGLRLATVASSTFYDVTLVRSDRFPTKATHLFLFIVVVDHLKVFVLVAVDEVSTR